MFETLTCLQGSVAIAALVKQAGTRIVVMGGGGVRSKNVAQLIAASCVTEVHSSARRYAWGTALHVAVRSVWSALWAVGGLRLIVWLQAGRKLCDL